MSSTITKENHRRRIVRIAFVGVLVGSVLLLIATIAWFSYLRFRIGTIESAFSAVEIGDHSSEVTQLLGTPDSVKRGDKMIWLSLLPDDLQDQCDEQYTYTRQTFFLPITWLVYFDDDEKVIMKWRLD